MAALMAATKTKRLAAAAGTAWTQTATTEVARPAQATPTAPPPPALMALMAMAIKGRGPAVPLAPTAMLRWSVPLASNLKDPSSVVSSYNYVTHYTNLAPPDPGRSGAGGSGIFASDGTRAGRGGGGGSGGDGEAAKKRAATGRAKQRQKEQARSSFGGARREWRLRAVGRGTTCTALLSPERQQRHRLRVCALVAERRESRLRVPRAIAVKLRVSRAIARRIGGAEQGRLDRNGK
jgi:hypothetical protein